MKLILVRGLPGSGKTTLARLIALGGYDHCEADQYFERDGEYQFDASKLADAHSYCQDATYAALRDGRSVVVSNTFSRLWEMDPYIQMAKECGATLHVITVEGQYCSIHNVPQSTIFKMRERWERYEA